MIPMEECVEGRVYLLDPPWNILVGVYVGDGTFVGIREKAGRAYLDREYHRQRDTAAGTAVPVYDLGKVPRSIPLQVSRGTDVEGYVRDNTALFEYLAVMEEALEPEG